MDWRVVDRSPGKREFLDSRLSLPFGAMKARSTGTKAKSGNLWLIGPIVAILVITIIIGMLIIYWMRRKGM